MGYIKIKQIWTKKERFEKKEAQEIFEIFKNESPVPIEEWKEIDLLGAIAKYGQFVHPETDKHDDTEGIQPKQLLWLKDELKEDFKPYLKIMAKTLNQNNSFFQEFITDGFISWNLVFDKFIKSNLSVEPKLRLGMLKIQFSKVFQQFKYIDNALIEKIGTEEITEYHISEAIKNKMIDSRTNTLKLEMLDLTAFLNERKNVWKENFGNVPQSEMMLRVNPKNFNKKMLDKIEEIYGTRQIIKLPQEKQAELSLIIDNFGMNIMALNQSHFKRNNLNYGNSEIKDFSLVLEKILKVKNIQLNNLKDLIKALTVYTPFQDYIMNMDITEEDMDVILYIVNIVNQIGDSSINNLNPQYFRMLFRYRIQSYKEIKKLITLFEKNKENKCSIPNLTGKVGKYSWEIIKKDNPIGLMLGYATDCCQVIDGAGQTCLYAGYEKENSTFFVVKKDNKIYAQSWVWTRKDTDYGSGFCFDSVEVLGKDLNKSKDILKCYEDASDELSKHYDVVYCGADGNTMPDGLESLGKVLNMDTLISKSLNCTFAAYSDLTRDNGGAIIIKRKDK